MSNPIEIKVNINNKWIDLTPKFNDFSIAKVRDNEQIFVMKTVANGNLDFYCDDYEILKDFQGKYLDGKLTENWCDDTKEYFIYLKLANSFDFGLKKISATVIIRDKYFEFFKQKGKYNFVTTKEISNLAGLDNTLIYEDGKITGAQQWEILTLLGFFVSKLESEAGGDGLYNFIVNSYKPSPYYSFQFANDLSLQTLAFTTLKKIQKYKMSSSGEYTTSLSALFEIIRNKFYSGFYITDAVNLPHGDFANYVMVNWFGKNLWTNGDDLTNLEKKNYKQILFLNDNNFAQIQHKTFDFISDEMDVESEMYSSTNINFHDIPDGQSKTINDFCSDIRQKEFDKDLPCVFCLEESISQIDFSKYSKQFYNSNYIPFLFADGDFDELILKTEPNVNSEIFFDTLSKLPKGQLHIEFNSNQSFATTFYLVAGVNNSAYFQRYQIQPGANYFNVSNSFWKNSLSFYCENVEYLNLIISDISVFVETDKFYYRLRPQIINGENYISGRTTPYFLASNFGAEMPTENATIDNQNFTVLKSNEFQQKIKYKNEKCIGNFDEFSLLKTSLGWLRVDEIKRTYRNNGADLTEITLTGKNANI